MAEPLEDAEAIVPRGRFWRFRRALRYHVVHIALGVVLRAYLRFRLEGIERLPTGPYVLCFSHLDWIDPMILMALWPTRPRVYFFGPKERDMRVGVKNRLMSWLGTAVPYSPEKTNLLESSRKVARVLDAGNVLAIAGEGRVGDREDTVEPLSEGPAFFAVRSQVPLVPVAVNGTRWLRFGKTIRIRVGEPIGTADRRATREEVDVLTAKAHAALSALVQGYVDRGRPGPFGRWLTEAFNDPGDRSRRAGPSPADPVR